MMNPQPRLFADAIGCCVERAHCQCWEAQRIGVSDVFLWLSLWLMAPWYGLGWSLGSGWCVHDWFSCKTVPIPSMGLVYLPTWMVVCYGFHVGKYTSPMDPMGCEQWDLLICPCVSSEYSEEISELLCQTHQRSRSWQFINVLPYHYNSTCVYIYIYYTLYTYTYHIHVIYIYIIFKPYTYFWIIWDFVGFQRSQLLSLVISCHWSEISQIKSPCIHMTGRK